MILIKAGVLTHKQFFRVCRRTSSSVMKFIGHNITYHKFINYSTITSIMSTMCHLYLSAMKFLIDPEIQHDNYGIVEKTFMGVIFSSTCMRA